MWDISANEGIVKLDNGLSGSAKVILRIPKEQFFPQIYGTKCVFLAPNTQKWHEIDFSEVTTTAADWDEFLINLAPSPGEFTFDAVQGRILNTAPWDKFGYNLDVDAAVPEVVWSAGGLFTPLTTAETLTITSASGNDTTSTGTGARSIVIYGVDGGQNEQIDVVQLTGATPVITTTTWLGINRMVVFLAGSSRVNEGTITATATTSTTTQAEIPAGAGTTQQCIFHIYAGFSGLFTWINLNVLKISAGGSPRVTIKGMVFSRVSNCHYEVFRESMDTNVENTITMVPGQPFPVSEKSIFYLEAETDTNNTIVNARFSLIQRKNL